MTNQFRLILLALGLLFFSMIFSLSKGSTSIPLDQLLFSKNDPLNTVFLHLRLTRTICAFVAGGLLALAGSLMQLLLQNPLADPYALGISGGAALATLLMMLISTSLINLLGAAWLGSLASIVLIFALSFRHRWQTHTLLLSGIALACGFSACISFVLLLSPNEKLHSMLFWLTGDLNGVAFSWLACSILFAGLILCCLLAPGFNVLAKGEMEARALGLHTGRYRILLYLLSSLFTATAVTLAGCIGFVGLIIPHLTRRLSGYDHRMLFPLSVILGGSLLVLADTLARSLFAPAQLPAGIFMAMLGVPVFVWLLQTC